MLKKETIITAIVFLGVGFLAGFAFNAHRVSLQRAKQQSAVAAASNANADSAVASDSTPSTAGPSDGAAIGGQLPKGHPPVSDAEVIQFFKQAASERPSDPAPRLKLADFLYDRRDFAQAINWYQQALALDPKDADARTDMATCFFNLGRAKEAVDQLHEALRSDPNHEPTLFNLAVVNLDGTHDFRAAEQALDRLEAINPGYPGLGQLQQAVSAATGAATSKPDPAGR